MNGLTFAQHITALLDIVLVCMFCQAIWFALKGLFIGISHILERKLEDRIQYDDDKRAEDFLAEVYIENGSEEDQ